MDSTKNHFEWSDSGLKLLRLINQTIDKNGGIDAMYEIVQAELNGYSYRANKLSMDESYRKMIRFNIKAVAAADILGVPIDTYQRGLREFKKKNNL